MRPTPQNYHHPDQHTQRDTTITTKKHGKASIPFNKIYLCNMGAQLHTQSSVQGMTIRIMAFLWKKSCLFQSRERKTGGKTCWSGLTRNQRNRKEDNDNREQTGRKYKKRAKFPSSQFDKPTNPAYKYLLIPIQTFFLLSFSFIIISLNYYNNRTTTLTNS